MCKNFHLLFFFVVLLMTTSCNRDSKESFVSNFENFVTETEINFKEYTESDWINADYTFDEFTNKQYLNWKDTMSPSEKNKFNKLVGKYNALKIKKNIGDFKEDVKDIYNQSKSTFEELVNDSTLLK